NKIQYGFSQIFLGLNRQKETPPIFINMAPETFKRVCSNFISNAIEASEKDEQIAVRIDDDGCFAQISIIDKGCGIPPHILQKLGEKGTTYGKPNGNGLGFWWARSAVERAGGQVSVKSKVGTGTEILIKIPIMVSNDPKGTCLVPKTGGLDNSS